ncbi:MAG: hypothetical protein AAF531_25870 [Actinomycetota bacterium]
MVDTTALLLLAQDGRTYREYLAIGIGIAVVVAMWLNKARRDRRAGRDDTTEQHRGN